MICDVVYDDTLARVRISATAVTGTKADIERSTDQFNWVPVRGGTAIDVNAGSIDPPISDYEFATTSESRFPSGSVCPTGTPAGIENFYRIQAYNPESMLLVTGGPDSTAETPDSAALDIVGDIDIRIGIRAEDWTPAEAEVLINKYNVVGDNRSWILQLDTGGTLSFAWSSDGTFVGIQANSIISTAAVGFLNGDHHAVRVTVDVDDGAGNNVVTFYTADTIDGPWLQLGTPITRVGITSIFAGNAAVRIAGDTPISGQAFFDGNVTKAEIRNGIDGTVVASPDFTDEPPGTTSFADAQGNTWTVDINAEIVEDPNPLEEPTITDSCIVSITPELGGVWLKSIYRPFLNRQIKVLGRIFAPVTRAFRGGIFDIVGRSVPVAVTDLRASREWALGVCTDTPEEAFQLDLILAGGDPLFLHIPGNSNLPIPSMHIVIPSNSSMLKAAFSDKRVWELPIQEVAAPPSDIVGSTSTWQTVLNTYATWQDVLNNHTSWADLLELVGDGSEVIVP